MMLVTRRYWFSAAHVLARPDWDAQRNRATYGKCANPAGHGHNYRLEVTLGGAVDRESGRVVVLQGVVVWSLLLSFRFRPGSDYFVMSSSNPEINKAFLAA